MRWWGCEAVRWRIGEWVRLWVGEVVNWWGCEAVRIWSCEDVRWRIGKWVRSCVGEVVNWWGCGLVKLWVGELMYSGVIGPSWVYKPVGPSALHFVYVRRLYLVSAQETHLNCLNPCCNGWCTRTPSKKAFTLSKASLNPCCNGWCTRTFNFADVFQPSTRSLNPCCNGWCTRTNIRWN